MYIHIFCQHQYKIVITSPQAVPTVKTQEQDPNCELLHVWLTEFYQKYNQRKERVFSSSSREQVKHPIDLAAAAALSSPQQPATKSNKGRNNDSTMIIKRLKNTNNQLSQEEMKQ